LFQAKHKLPDPENAIPDNAIWRGLLRLAVP
jgi:hypothetical protein